MIFTQFNQEQDEIERISQMLDLSSWVAINQLVPVALQDWLGHDPWFARHGLDEPIKRALALEVEKVIRERESRTREIERKVEMERTQAQAKLQFPRDPGSTIQRYF